MRICSFVPFDFTTVQGSFQMLQTDAQFNTYKIFSGIISHLQFNKNIVFVKSKKEICALQVQRLYYY